MRKPVALFFADSHLDVSAWAARPTLSGDSMFSFEFIVTQAINLGVKVVVGAGDLIDVKRPSPVVAKFIRVQMDRLKAAGIEFWFTQGQHEYAIPPWNAAIHDAPVWIHQQSKSIDMLGQHRSINVYGIDWTPADKLEEALELVPENTDVLVMHQVWDEFMGEVRGCEGSWSQVPFATTLFTGDYHATHHLRSENGRAHVGAHGQPLTVISPGSTNMRKVDEPEDKHFFLLFSDNAWEKRKILTRPVLRVSAFDDDALDQICDNILHKISRSVDVAKGRGLPEQLVKPILHFAYADDLESPYSRVRDIVSEQAHLFHKAVKQSAEDSEILLSREQRNLAASKGLTGYLELLVAREDPDFRALLPLLDSDDPKTEIEAMRNERFKVLEDARAEDGDADSRAIGHNQN